MRRTVPVPAAPAPWPRPLFCRRMMPGPRNYMHGLDGCLSMDLPNAGDQGCMALTTRSLLAAVLSAVAVAVAPSAASADLLPTTTTTLNPITDWSTLLPSLAPAYNP